MKGPRQRITIDPTAPDPNLLAEAVSILCDGGVVAYPTETFYGLAVDALDPGARARVFAIKGRERDQQLPCIVADLTQLEQLVGEIPEMVRRAAERLWPGPITLVLRVRTELEATLGTTVAVRVSSLPVARELARATGSPITSRAPIGPVPSLPRPLTRSNPGSRAGSTSSWMAEPLPEGPHRPSSTRPVASSDFFVREPSHSRLFGRP